MTVLLVSNSPLYMEDKITICSQWADTMTIQHAVLSVAQSYMICGRKPTATDEMCHTRKNHVLYSTVLGYVSMSEEGNINCVQHSN